MTDHLHSIAQNDTPAAVEVPNNMQGLVMWMVGRFGGGILLAIACAWALGRVYDDHAKQNDRILSVLEQRARVDSEMTSALLQLRSAIDEVARESRAAHMRSYAK
jgi:hypothetical protein